MSNALGKVAAESRGVVVLLIAGAEEERDAAAADGGDERGDRGRFRLQRVELLGVAADEFRPERRIVGEPTPQADARREVLQPEVDGRGGLRQPARPEAIDENAYAVAFRRR